MSDSRNQQPNVFHEIIGSISRAPKPRMTGRTMVIDWGMGPNRQNDLLETAAPFFDFAKVAVGISALLSAESMTTKLASYREHGVEAFPGGQFFEFAEVQGRADAYLPAVREVGYSCVEVSDNMAAVSLAWKERMIRRAVDEFDMTVIGEVGQKEGLGDGHSLADDAKACVGAGAGVVLLEAAELVTDESLIDEVVEAVGLEMVMFELPGPWIDGVHACDIHRMRRLLLDRFGCEVNIGNCDPDEVLPLEAYRCGLGVNAGRVEDSE